jgi:hypothetical protein
MIEIDRGCIFALDLDAVFVLEAERGEVKGTNRT